MGDTCRHGVDVDGAGGRARCRRRRGGRVRAAAGYLVDVDGAVCIGVDGRAGYLVDGAGRCGYLVDVDVVARMYWPTCLGMV
jgi:hypothetical protein